MWFKSWFFHEKSWLENKREVDIFDLKADLYSCLKLMNINLNNLKILKDSKPYYHPGKAVQFSLEMRRLDALGKYIQM